MKKLSTLLIIAFALVLGLTQCKKKVDTIATPSDLGEAVHITVNVDDGGKHIVYPGTGAYVFENGDKLYVGNGGHYIGYLTYGSGAFSGDIYSPSTEDYLHFYFVGGLIPSATPVPGTTANFTVNIADQSSNLPVLSYAHSTQKYVDGTATYGCTLLNKCGLVKFVPATATPETVKVGGMKTTATINFATSGITPTNATGTITLYPESEEAKWAILLPQDEVSNTDGIIGKYCCTISKVPEVTENMYSSIGVSMAVKPGMLSGLFTINPDGDKVHFSQGNLQYIGSDVTPYWKFADNQYEYFGRNEQHHSSASDIDRDLFGWGTSGISGYSPIATCYQPWSTSTKYDQYNPYGSLETNLYDGGDNAGKADWGYNKISNGGDKENFGWRTLTSAEWVYLFNTRSTENTINSTQNARYTEATINTDGTSVNGIILFPDQSIGDTPTGVSWGTINGASAWGTKCTTAGWNALEAAGCVFLPAAGYRGGSSVYNAGSSGYYWSSTYDYSNSAYSVHLYASSLIPQIDINRYNGYSVRLVCQVEE